MVSLSLSLSDHAVSHVVISINRDDFDAVIGDHRGDDHRCGPTDLRFLLLSVFSRCPAGDRDMVTVKPSPVIRVDSQLILKFVTSDPTE